MRKPLYVQLYSLRHETQQDAEAVLRQVPTFGYQGIETAGDYGWSDQKWTDLLAETGLKAIACHVGLAPLEKGDRPIEFAKSLGMTYVIVPFLAPDLQNPEGYRQAAKRLTEVAGRVHQAGLKFGYHHHAFEFENHGGERGIDILLKGTDPALVVLEIDTYWVEKAGENAAQFIRQNAARTRLLHLKDFRKSDGLDTPTGDGDVAMAPVIEVALERDLELVVEYEGDNAPEAVRKSAANLKGLLK